jgi:long-chain acyl-CoA synthetase
MAVSPLLTEFDLHLSYVPVAHMLERSVLLLCIASGAAIGFYRGRQTELLDDLRVAKPTFFVGLPGAFRQMVRRRNSASPPRRTHTYTMSHAHTASLQHPPLLPPPPPFLPSLLPF